MQDWIIDFIGQFGYISILLLIFIENIFPPIPSEVVLVFGGFITITTDMNPWLVILFATIGAVLGAIALYWLGYALGQAGLKKLFSSKLGRALRLKESDVDKAESFFIKYEYKAVFFGRCVPVVRSLISIPAGMAKMKFAPFLFLTTLGSAIWNTIMVWLGVFASDAWESIVMYIGWYSKLILVIGVIVAAIAAVIYFKVLKNRKKAIKDIDTLRNTDGIPSEIHSEDNHV